MRVTCYFRHIVSVFDSIGIKVTDENKKEIDRRIHEIAGIEYKNCSATWKKFKELRSKNEKALMMELKEKLADFSA
jgi:hypothetical protein